MENTIMPNHSILPRILFVTPEAAFRPERGNRWTYAVDDIERSLGNFPAEMISELFELGADVYVAHADFRDIFKSRSGKGNSSRGGRLPGDPIYLAEDRVFFYSKPPIQIPNGKISRSPLPSSGRSSTRSYREFNRI
jgi:hypothetical protein